MKIGYVRPPPCKRTSHPAPSTTGVSAPELASPRREKRKRDFHLIGRMLTAIFHTGYTMGTAATPRQVRSSAVQMMAGEYRLNK